MSNLSFREINAWDAENVVKKFLPSQSSVVMTTNSNIIAVVERNQRSRDILNIHLLDRIATAIERSKDITFKIFGKRVIVSQDDAVSIARVLNEQAKKLESMAATYRIMATALLISKDNFGDIVKGDQYVSGLFNNPFD